MRGIICAGGGGSRLWPLTEVTNKHLLGVYNMPMIFYPLYTLLDAGIKEIMIVSSNEHTGAFLRLLGSGAKFDAKFSFKVQDESGGIAQAIGLCREFASGDNVTVILGDNIFEDDFSEEINNFSSGAKLFLKDVPDANRFGVAEIVDGKVVSVEEKPKIPKSNYAITGLYIYDSNVFDIISNLKFSGRGELEITDVNNAYIDSNSMLPVFVKDSWTDAGTFESLYRANTLARKISLKNDKSSNNEKSSSNRIDRLRHAIEIQREVSR